MGGCSRSSVLHFIAHEPSYRPHPTVLRKVEGSPFARRARDSGADVGSLSCFLLLPLAHLVFLSATVQLAGPSSYKQNSRPSVLAPFSVTAPDLSSSVPFPSSQLSLLSNLGFSPRPATTFSRLGRDTELFPVHD